MTLVKSEKKGENRIKKCYPERERKRRKEQKAKVRSVGVEDL